MSQTECDFLMFGHESNAFKKPQNNTQCNFIVFTNRKALIKTEK